MLPAVLIGSLGLHGVLLAVVAVLPPPTYAAAPETSELAFHVIAPEPEPEPEPVVEPEPPEALPEPEPVLREPEPPEARPEPPEPVPDEAPPPPPPVLTAGAAGPDDPFVMHPGEEDGALGGVPGGTGVTVGAAPTTTPPAPAPPERRGMSRAELRRRLVQYIRGTLHGYVNQRIRMPLVARREHLEGTVIVRIRLARDGRVLGARLSRSSGHDLLDEAAVASIGELATVPAPPADIPWDPDEELPLPVRYQLR